VLSVTDLMKNLPKLASFAFYLACGECYDRLSKGVTTKVHKCSRVSNQPTVHVAGPSIFRGILSRTLCCSANAVRLTRWSGKASDQCLVSTSSRARGKCVPTPRRARTGSAARCHTARPRCWCARESETLVRAF